MTIAQMTPFISFEGTEGVGKTTAISHLCNRLQEQGIDFVRTREPGGSQFSERLRQILLDPQSQIHDDSELLLMFAARSDHLAQLILPALHEGKWVICDRFTDSTIAYQGFGRMMDTHDNTHDNTYDNNRSVESHQQQLAKIQTLTDLFVPRLPDMTFWLDLPVRDGLARACKRSVADRFEQQTVAFFERVYQGYDYLANKHPKRIYRIDASGTAEQVAMRIWACVSNSKF